MQRTDDQTMKKGLGIITAQVERVTKLMNQLLALARRGPPNLRPVDLRDLINRCLDTIEERLSRHRVQVVAEHDGELPPINGDSDLMMQVLLNLMLNAMQAMPECGTLRLAAARDGEHHLALRSTGLYSSVLLQQKPCPSPLLLPNRIPLTSFSYSGARAAHLYPISSS